MKPDEEKASPKVAGGSDDAQSVSRREFVASAAVKTAVAGLFGVLTFEEVAARAMGRLSSRQVLMGVGNQVAGDIHQLGVPLYAHAQGVHILHEQECTSGYTCPPQQTKQCSSYSCGSTGGHYDCVEFQFDCTTDFHCYDFRCGPNYLCGRRIICDSGKFTCTAAGAALGVAIAKPVDPVIPDS